MNHDLSELLDELERRFEEVQKIAGKMSRDTRFTGPGREAADNYVYQLRQLTDGEK